MKLSLFKRVSQRINHSSKKILYSLIAVILLGSLVVSISIVMTASQADPGPTITETLDPPITIETNDGSRTNTSELALPINAHVALPPALTDYQDYAQADDEGFAYLMVRDPDISSKIIPIDDQSSEDILLLTFDDGPNEHSLEIAEQLAELNVGALFIVNGMNLESASNRAILQEIHRLGFEIGNHTLNHPNLNKLSYEEQKQEILQNNELIEEITGDPVRWFRPPYGEFNMDTIDICNELGLQLITWSFGYDWMEEYEDVEDLIAISIDNEHLHSGANILMHDLPWTAEAIVPIINEYRAMGYHLVDPYLIKHQKNSAQTLNRLLEAESSN